MNTFPVLGADQLHFQVVVITQALFDKYPAIAELAFGIILQLPVYPAEPLDLGHLLDAHAAAARRRLDEDGGLFDAVLFLRF